MTKRKERPIGNAHSWRAMNAASASISPSIQNPVPSQHFRCGDCKRVLPNTELHHPAYSTCRPCKLMRVQKGKT